jgi:hypothetical protein
VALHDTLEENLVEDVGEEVTSTPETLGSTGAVDQAGAVKPDVPRPLIAVSRLRKDYGDVCALADVSLAVREASFSRCSAPAGRARRRS